MVGFGGAASGILSMIGHYFWIVIIIVGIIIFGLLIFLLVYIVKTRKRWTHNFEISTVDNDFLSEQKAIIRARRKDGLDAKNVFILEEPFRGESELLQPYQTNSKTFKVAFHKGRFYSLEKIRFIDGSPDVTAYASHTEMQWGLNEKKIAMMTEGNRKYDWSEIAKAASWVLMAIIFLVIAIYAFKYMEKNSDNSLLQTQSAEKTAEINNIVATKLIDALNSNFDSNRVRLTPEELKVIKGYTNTTT